MDKFKEKDKLRIIKDFSFEGQTYITGDLIELPNDVYPVSSRNYLTERITYNKTPMDKVDREIGFIALKWYVPKKMIENCCCLDEAQMCFEF